MISASWLPILNESLRTSSVRASIAISARRRSLLAARYPGRPRVPYEDASLPGASGEGMLRTTGRPGARPICGGIVSRGIDWREISQHAEELFSHDGCDGRRQRVGRPSCRMYARACIRGGQVCGFRQPAWITKWTGARRQWVFPLRPEPPSPAQLIIRPSEPQLSLAEIYFSQKKVRKIADFGTPVGFNDWRDLRKSRCYWGFEGDDRRSSVNCSNIGFPLRPDRCGSPSTCVWVAALKGGVKVSLHLGIARYIFRLVIKRPIP